MKTFETKVKIMEAKAKLRLFRSQAKKLEKQAAKFREDALKLACELEVSGVSIYKETVHPAYHELILPLVERASKIGSNYGFNTLYQTHTPMPGISNLTSCIGSIDEKIATETMKGCIALIATRPVVSGGASSIEKLFAAVSPAENSETDSENSQ